jgi:putative membrane protein
MNDERKRWLMKAPHVELSKKLCAAAWVLSSAVILLVVIMQRVKLPLPVGWSTAGLPLFHAVINALVAVTLLISLSCIKLGRVKLHRATMVTAMLLSVLFLMSYVVYHMTNEATRYGGAGSLKAIYILLLVTHIISAAVSLPFILFTFIAGWTNHFAAHRRLTRWVFPLWLYVAVTGPICYWMLRPYY